MTTPKGLSETISKQRDAERTPNVNTGDTYYNYEMHELTPFSVCADVPCTLSFLPLSVFRGSRCEFLEG